MASLGSSIFILSTLGALIPVNPGDDFETIVQNAQPGDEIVFSAGEYTTTGYWGVNLAGEENAPIIVRAAPGEMVTIFGDPSQNTIDISGSWYTFAGFRIQGGSHGVRVGNSSHAVFEDLEIFLTADVGLSCNRPGETYEDITIRRVHVHDTAGTGECFYLGCNDGACTMFDSLVEFNWCHDTFNSSQGDGIELKTGSYGVTIRHNVIHDVQYPGITMYGTQGQAPNVVEGNIVWNSNDNGIQTVGDVIVRNNVVVGSGNNGIQAKPSQAEVPTNVTIVHNTVVGAGDACLRANDWPADNGNLVAGNALFCDGTYAIRLVNSVPGEFVDNGVVGAIEGLMTGTFDLGSSDVELVDAAASHVYPNRGSSLIGAATGVWADDDFNCLARDGTPDVGAYEHMGASNPGWIPEPGFKQCAGGDDGDGDTTDDGNADDPSTGDVTGDGDEDPDDGTTTANEAGDEVGTSEGDTDGPVDSDTDSDTGDDAAAGSEDGCACSGERTDEAAWPWLLIAFGLFGLSGHRHRAAETQLKA
jgi:MYXO-CTERM domain-containing protein